MRVLLILGALYLHILAVYAQDTAVWQIDTLVITGNKITKAGIIVRELPFELHTPQHGAYSQQLERFKNNLMNTALFNAVEIRDTLVQQRRALIIRVKERWYIWPQPILEQADRNFNAWITSGDWSRVNYGVHFLWYNFRGRNEILKLKVRWGFSRELGLEYEAPYVNKRKTLGLSGFVKYAMNQKLAVNTNLENKRDFLYGSDILIHELRTGVTLEFRPQIYNYHIFSIRYTYATLSDTVIQSNPEYFGAGRSTLSNIDWSYHFVHDKRDYRPYPKKGNWWYAGVQKRGWAGMEDGFNHWWFDAGGAIYKALGKRFYVGGALDGKFSVGGAQPYYLQRGLGYQHFVRGYELYVMDGQHYVLGRSHVKWGIVENKNWKLKWLKWEKFNTIPINLFLNIHFDAGYVWDLYNAERNPLANSVLYGGGLGLDFVTYYDFVFRLEGSMNSKGEPGIFLHFENAF